MFRRRNDSLRRRRYEGLSYDPGRVLYHWRRYACLTTCRSLRRASRIVSPSRTSTLAVILGVFAADAEPVFNQVVSTGNVRRTATITRWPPSDHPSNSDAIGHSRASSGYAPSRATALRSLRRWAGKYTHHLCSFPPWTSRRNASQGAPDSDRES